MALDKSLDDLTPDEMLKVYTTFKTFSQCAFKFGCSRRTWARRWYDSGLPNPRFVHLSPDRDDETRYQVGLISDLHLGSKQQQLSALLDFMRILCENDVHDLVICGDIIEGIMPRPGAEHGRFLHSIDEYFEYTVSVFDKFVDNFNNISLVNGNHDQSINSRSLGFNFASNLSSYYKLIVYKGDESIETYDLPGGAKAIMHHGTGGCSANLTSRTRNIAIKYLNYNSNWDFLICGHCHRSSADYWVGKHAFSCGCFQSITDYLASKLLVPTVEGSILSYTMSDKHKPVDVRNIIYNYDDKLKFKDW